MILHVLLKKEHDISFVYFFFHQTPHHRRLVSIFFNSLILFPIITHVLYLQNMQYLCTCMHITCHALNHIYMYFLRDIVVCQVSPRQIFGNFTI